MYSRHLKHFADFDVPRTVLDAQGRKGSWEDEPSSLLRPRISDVGHGMNRYRESGGDFCFDSGR